MKHFVVIFISLLLAAPAVAHHQLLYEVGSPVKGSPNEVYRKLQVFVKKGGSIIVKERIKYLTEYGENQTWYENRRVDSQLTNEWRTVVEQLSIANLDATVIKNPYAGQNIICVGKDLQKPDRLINHLYQNTSEPHPKFRLIDGNGPCYSGEKAHFERVDLVNLAKRVKAHLASLALKLIYGESQLVGSIQSTPSLWAQYDFELEGQPQAAFASAKILDSGLVDVYLTNQSNSLGMAELSIATSGSENMGATYSFQLDSLAHEKIREFMLRLRQEDSVSKRALKRVCPLEESVKRTINHLYFWDGEENMNLVYGPNDCSTGQLVRPKGEKFITAADQLKTLIQEQVQMALQVR